jgi:hypothetical protein
MMAARLVALSSCRTLPGQSCRFDRNHRVFAKRQAAPLLQCKASQECLRQQDSIALTFPQRRNVTTISASGSTSPRENAAA